MGLARTKKGWSHLLFFSISLVINSLNQRKFLCRGKAWFSERFPKIFFFDKDFGGRREIAGDYGRLRETTGDSGDKQG